MSLENFTEKLRSGEIDKEMLIDMITNPDLRDAMFTVSKTLIKLIDAGFISEESLTVDEKKFIKEMEKTEMFKTINKDYRAVKIQNFLYTALRIFQEGGLIKILDGNGSNEEVPIDPEKEAKEIFSNFKKKKNNL